MITAVSAAALEHKGLIIKLATHFRLPVVYAYRVCGSRRPDGLRNRHYWTDVGDALEVLPDRGVVMLYDALARARLSKQINHCELKKCFLHKLQNLSIPR